MKQIRHVGVAGDCDPYEFKDYLDSIDSGIKFTTTATAVTTYIKELLSSGYKVTVFTIHFGDLNYYHFHGKQLQVFSVPQKHVFKGMALFSRIYVSKRMYRIMKDNMAGIDVLHAQWTYEAAVASLSFVDVMPVFCTVRDWCPYIMKMQKRLRDRIVWYISYISCFRKVFSNNKIHYIANSKYTWDRISKIVPENRIDIIPNPIDKRYVLTTKEQLSNKTSFISICGNLEDPRKNILKLIKAFYIFRQNHPEASLTLVGTFSDTFRNKIVEFNGNSSEGLVFTGCLPHEDLFKHIDTSHCLIHPALEETFGNILLEAMARKTVCIGGKNSGAVPQVLERGNAGILCDVQNVDSIISAMETSLDINICNTLIDNASKKIEDIYRSDKNMQFTIDVYKKYM